MGCSNPHPHCQVSVRDSSRFLGFMQVERNWSKGWDRGSVLVMWQLGGEGSACSSLPLPLDRCGPAVSCQILPSVRKELSGPITVKMESPC